MTPATKVSTEPAPELNRAGRGKQTRARCRAKQGVQRPATLTDCSQISGGAVPRTLPQDAAIQSPGEEIRPVPLRDSDVHGRTYLACLPCGSVDSVTQAVIQYALDRNRRSTAARWGFVRGEATSACSWALRFAPCSLQRPQLANIDHTRLGDLAFQGSPFYGSESRNTRLRPEPRCR